MNYPKLKPEIKKEWVSALRSGKFLQGSDNLRSVDNEYCCLGVLCEIEGLETSANRTNFEYIFPNGEEDGYYESAEPPSFWFNEFFETYEILDDSISPTKVMEYLIEMNDREYNTFDEIADWIEENL